MKSNITLFEAHRWIAHVRGRDQLDDANTKELIALLAGNTLPSTGRRTMVAGDLREAIPADVWGNALYEGDLPPAGTPDHVRFNSLSFIDGHNTAGDGFGGALTLAGEDIPCWYDIRVREDQLGAVLFERKQRGVGYRLAQLIGPR